MIVVNSAEFEDLAGMIAIARAYHAGATADFEGIVSYAQRALEVLPGSESVWRGSAAALLGIAHWVKGDLDMAGRCIADASLSMRRVGDVSGAISTIYLLAELKAVMGRLRDAERDCRKALEMASAYDGPTPQGTADIHVCLAAIHYQRGVLDLAEAQLLKARALPSQALLPESRHYLKTGGAVAQHARRILSLPGGTAALPEAAGVPAEPLSERELDVLRLLAGDLSGPQIADRLYISLNTLRTHSKRIYAKLGVNSRRAAVSPAAEIGLLPR